MEFIGISTALQKGEQMKIELSTEKILCENGEIEIIFVVEKNLEHEFVKDIETLKKLKFKGENDQIVYLHDTNRIYAAVEASEIESFKIAAATVVKKLKTLDGELRAKIAIYDNDSMAATKAIAEGFWLGNYEFKQYKSKKDDEKDTEIEIVFCACSSYEKVDIDFESLEKVLVEAKIITDAVNFTRDIVNTPPNDFYPKIFARRSKELAAANKLDCKVYDDEYLASHSMGAMLAVSLASQHRPRLVHLSYKPQNPKAKVVLIGKGLTYDSGGLSLKPSDYMVSMKADKSGASTVLGIMKAISELGLDVEVHGICGVVENMIGGNAYKPDDVLKAKNGTTIEVRNTDAEGRLVLADCLCYAQDEVPEFDYILDLATLTGACVVGLGEYTSGIMGHNEDIKCKLVEAAKKSSEYVGILPFNRHLKKLIKSEIADVCNISSSRYGGAITAGLFLDKFIKDENKEKWAHLDIAGPAYVEKTWGVNPFGASGAGVALIVEFLKNL